MEGRVEMAERVGIIPIARQMAKVSALMLAFETINHEVRIDPIMVAQQCHITADELGTIAWLLFSRLLDGQN